MGHGIDDHTPGGISGNGTQEFVADTFGASTESFANEPAPFDVPDFTVGEQINLVGNGPIRNMANPAALGDPNCFSSAIPTTEVHAAAGPGNHWFYLLANGSSPTNGQPTSPTCNNSAVVGLGVQTAIRIMYNAMLIKTSASSYLTYRTGTLQAAKTLFPWSCREFNTVKAAWDAVSVPAQPSDPTCVTTPPLNAGDRSAAKCGAQGCATLWQNADGRVELWLMNGATITGQPIVSAASADWVIQGAGDFDHDGNSDILWRNADGRVEFWLMNGGTTFSQPVVGSASADWTIQGIGDFNHDGNSDILWRNLDGRVELWLLNGATILAQPIVSSASSDWSIQGVGDFNHDGNDDILWRNLDGRVELWLMNGGTTIAQPVVGSAGNDWTIEGAGDFDHDGNSDILWRNVNGTVELWLMNGGTIVSQPIVGSATSDWTIDGVGNL
jgi:hypothetical protein